MVPDQQRAAGSFRTALLVLAAALCAVPSRAALFVPRDDAEVVEQLRVRPLDRTDIEYRRQRLLLRAAPDNLRLALAVARRSTEIARRDGDPRYLGYAQAALSPWWSLAEPAPAVRLMRANILQSTHQFPAALEELRKVLRAEPGNAQAWLTQASIYQVQGRYGEARASCQSLSALGASQYAEGCLAEIAGLTGRPHEARDRLDALTRNDPSTQWLAIVQAELAERSGDFVAADRFFRAALSGTADAYCKAAYADFLLDRRRFREVVNLLQYEQRADALLLRLALAYSALHDPAAGASVAALRARFDAAQLRGDSAHRREQARFTLQLLQQPQAALVLALANWQVQKEPADARVLLEAARAAKQPGAAVAVRAFIRAQGWTDQRLLSYLSP